MTHYNEVDWDAVFREPTPEENKEFEAKQALQEKMRLEVDYQRSKFCKKWAPTYEIAKEKLIAGYLNAKMDHHDWSNRQYSANRKLVTLGGKFDDFDISEKSISEINSARKKNKVRHFEVEMEEALKDLAILGIPRSELLEIQNMELPNKKKNFTDDLQEKQMSQRSRTIRDLPS